MQGIPLRQSTAAQSRMVGPFIDDTDFKTVETGLTIANTNVKLNKVGAAGVNKNSGGGTHRNNGMYSLTFDATDSNTVGELTGSVLVAGALVVTFKFIVMDEVAYDSLYATAATILTNADAGLLYKSTIGTVNSQVSFDMDDALASNDVAIGNTVTFVDAGDSTNFHITYITDLDKVNDRILTKTGPADWTIAVGDTARIKDTPHPAYHAAAELSTFDTAKQDHVVAFAQLMARGDADILSGRATELGQLNNDFGGGAGTFTPVTDSEEALRNNQVTLADVSAIKAKTDQLAFSGAGNVDANVLQVGDGDPIVAASPGGEKYGEA